MLRSYYTSFDFFNPLCFLLTQNKALDLTTRRLGERADKLDLARVGMGREPQLMAL